MRWLVNPLLAGVCVWLTFRLGSKLLGNTVGLLAAGLTASSPFFLMNSGVLLSHPLGLFFALVFCIAWLDALEGKPNLPAWLSTLTAGGALGALVLTRPFTALGVAVPFFIQGIIILFRSKVETKKRVISIGILTLLVSGLHLLWQYAVTGDPTLNPYTLWWEYDKIGFGPGVGVTESGHSLKYAYENLKFSLNAGYSDLFGWFRLSWLFLPFGLWSLRRRGKTWPVVAVAPVLIVIYMAYWVGAWVLGPRYYFEGLFSLTITTAAGIAMLAGLPLKVGRPILKMKGKNCYRLLAVISVVAFLAFGNLFFYLPLRIGGMRHLFGVSRQQLVPFEQPDVEAFAPALIIVKTENWRDYAVLLERSSPTLDSPFIFAWDRGPGPNQRVMDSFPDRTAYFYNPDNPWVFYRIFQ
jgi:4-amino-4-deoxy-L-arabinose transferase-like glycosyltransferase